MIHKEEMEDIKQIMHMAVKPNKKLSRDISKKTTGKPVTLRDISNISAKLCHHVKDLQVTLDRLNENKILI